MLFPRLEKGEAELLTSQQPGLASRPRQGHLRNHAAARPAERSWELAHSTPPAPPPSVLQNKAAGAKDPSQQLRLTGLPVSPGFGSPATATSDWFSRLGLAQLLSPSLPLSHLALPLSAQQSSDRPHSVPAPNSQHTPSPTHPAIPPTPNDERGGQGEAGQPGVGGPSAIAGNISYHAQYSPTSPLAFGPEQAFYATAESVRDHLLQVCARHPSLLRASLLARIPSRPTTFHGVPPGRALTNAIGNLGITGAYADAIKKFGYELEAVAGQKFSPWEIVRHDIVYPIRFFGMSRLPDGRRKWAGGEVLSALAYDVPIPGYKTKNAISLRLWDAKATAADFNLFQFNDGQYESAAQLHSRAQQICAVLYPGDATEEGKLLRLKQQYFLCSASLQDIIFRFKERKPDRVSGKWSEFPSKVAVQMNDTHPTLAIPELMRLLMDEEGLGWDEAWDVTNKTVAYTNHTVLPEALEKWSQAVMRKLLPRHMEIIEEIDKRVNGVAELHSNILKEELFADYLSIWPKKFQNKTNGITPRRWLRFCNPELSEIVTKWLKTDQWTSNLDLLTGLRKFADDEKLHAEWAAAKLASKKRLAKHVLDVTGITIDPNSLFDIQIKRIHEYKRQLMNILGAVYRYKKLKEMSAEERQKVTPRTVMVGGKAFATYTNAKRIVKLVNDVGAVVNNDADVNKYLKVVFIPNYNVSVAEVLIPGSELSQHISTAGMEASGTSNMKFSLNGCVIIGTLDGANVEIREEVGQDNFFLFGAKADQIAGLRKERENGLFKPDPRFEEAKQFIRSGAFGTYDYTPLLDSLEGNTGFGRGDYFLVGYDFPSYIEAQARVDEAYKDKKKWIKMSILNTAGSGKFSSDRTIDQYAKEIWGISACPVP
ncbi:hypothetical protein ZWY2020_051295 [Hordeum vulgare]|nr:hypothetical protein ZWY2020_051295 [Hordeum vulgare]